MTWYVAFFNWYCTLKAIILNQRTGVKKIDLSLHLCVHTAMILASLRIGGRCVLRICLVIMCNYTRVYLVACVRYYMLIWYELFLSEPPSTCTAFMCARTQQWIRCACEQRMPWWDSTFAQALRSCRCSHINRQVCLISWHVFQIVFCDFVSEEEAIRAWKRSRF